MKQLKRFSAILLSLALLLSLLPQLSISVNAAVYSGVCGVEGDGSNLRWSLDTNTGTLTITGSGAMKDYSTHIFDNYDADPWYEAAGFPIDELAPWVRYRKDVRSLSLPEGLTKIGINAFLTCDRLTSVTIPNSVVHIEHGAFAFCSALESVRIGDGVEHIGSFLYNYTTQGAFESCSALKIVTFGSGLKRIDDRTFFYCTSLESIAIPYGVERIDRMVFDGCTNLKYISLPDSVAYLGQDAFRNTAYVNTKDNWKGGILYLGNWVLDTDQAVRTADVREGTIGIAPYAFIKHFDSQGVKTVTLPNSLTHIGAEAFMMSSELERVTIPDSVAVIDRQAFNLCAKLNNLFIPSGVQRIEEAAFCDCDALTDVMILSKDVVFGEGALGTTAEYAQAGEPFDFRYNANLTIRGYAGSTAETYAREHGFRFLDIANPTNRFFDVAPGAYYSNAVSWSVTKEITSGTGNGNFSPNSPCTRGQVVTFLWRASGCPEPRTATHPFTDVKPGAYYYKAMLWAVENEITTGATESTFAPNKSCTRGQVVTFLWRAKGRPEPQSVSHPFKDVNESGYYYKAMLWAVENGITTGASASTFSPSKTCTRGQVVTFLYRAAQE